MPLALEPETSPWPGNRRRRRRRWTALTAALAVGAAVSVSALSDPRLDGLRVDYDLVYRPDSPRICRLDLYRPEGQPPPEGWPVVVAIHGGGWSGGSRRGYGHSLARLARHGLAVASVGYHLSTPDGPGWPRNRDDLRASVVWLRSHAREYGLDPTRVAALGASAGGHLAAILGLDPGPSVHGVSARVSGVVDFYGPADLAALADVPNARAAVRGLLGAPVEARPDLAEAASPLQHVSKDDPPMLLIHGSLDPTVPVGQSRKLAQMLQITGVPHRLIEVQGAAHGFGLTGPGHNFLPEILEFLEECWDDTQRYRSPEAPSAPSGTPPLVPDRHSPGP